MLRVLVLPSFYSYSGQERCGSFFRDHAQALSRAGASVSLAYVEPRRLKQFSFRALQESHWQCVVADEAGVTTIRQKGWNPLLGTSLGGRIWASLLARLVLRKCPDLDGIRLIHAHNALFAGLAARSLSKRLGIPYVVTEHSSAFLMGAIKPAEARLAKLVYRDADAVIAVSRALADAITTYCEGKSPSVVPNVVDTTYFTPPEAHRGGETFQVFAGGNLTRNKGFDVLIRAFAAACGNFSECRLTIMGAGPERTSLEKLVVTLNIRGQVTFTGPIPRSAVREQMRAADVYVISSYHETFGVVAIEAMATGVPVIATRCGGPEDIVTPETGWLVAPGAVDEMQGAIAAARKHRPDLTASRARFVERFSMPAVARQLLSVYHDVFAQRGIRARNSERASNFQRAN
jgi:glycosyltransferase involved in cell wall biosynthesis